ncbi:MAG: universal stress protein [Chloroflexi bacterium]|nr:universal stress protein [Chloroflexota bacterium]
MFRKILVAYDGSTGSKRALEVAVDVAQKYHAELWALSVEEHLPRFAATVGEVVEEKEFENHFFAEVQVEAVAFAGNKGVDVKTEILPGHAAETVVRFAREHSFDLIVLSHIGHSALWGALLGGTSERISHHAHCTVMIVR